jgi:MFS family permease
MTQLSAATTRLEVPTRVRYGVLGFACALSMITYLDRVCFAYAVGPLGKSLGLISVADFKWAFVGFTLAYAAFEIPSGWMGDAFGPRIVLIRIVLWWSLFTALTGLVGLSFVGLTLGLTSLVVIRFLFGLGEAGAYPNITRALHNWFPFHERGMAQGMVWMCGRFMGGLTPFVWLVLVEGVSWERPLDNGVVETVVFSSALIEWRSTFLLFGCLGIVWCILFALWFRNRPEQKSSVNAAELELIRRGSTEKEADHKGVPWLRLLKNVNLWLLCLMYFFASYGWYFNITYLPTFLEEQFGVSPKSLLGSVYKGGPLWMGAMACLAGGWLTDWFIRHTGNRKWGRRTFGVAGHGLCAVCYLSCLIMPSAFTFFLGISLAAFCNDLTMGAAWATCQDIGRRYTAIVAGCMNTIGNLGGMVAGWLTGAILDGSLASYAAAHNLDISKLHPAEKAAGLLPGYHLNFWTFGAAYAVAALLWLRIDATRPVAE